MMAHIHIFVTQYYKRSMLFICLICSMQEIVYLSNSFCKKDFPNNQAGNFQNKLNKSLTFKTKGKVALEILYTPGSWDNVRPGTNAIGIEIYNYPIFNALYGFKELFVYSVETLETGQLGYSDVVCCVYRYKNGIYVEHNIVGKYSSVIGTAPFQRLTVKIKETKIDAITTDSTYAIYDSLYRTYKPADITYYYYDYLFDEGLKKPTEFNKKSVWIMSGDYNYIGTPVSTTKFLHLRNYENVNNLLEILTEKCNDALEELLKEHAIPRILEWPYQSLFNWPHNAAKTKNWIITFYNDIQLKQDILAKRKVGEGRVRLGIAFDYPVKVKITLPSSIAYMLGLTEHLNIGKY